MSWEILAGALNVSEFLVRRFCASEMQDSTTPTPSGNRRLCSRYYGVQAEQVGQGQSG